jgi:RNA polymerase sigma factor (sigma-70 family)
VTGLVRRGSCLDRQDGPEGEILGGGGTASYRLERAGAQPRNEENERLLGFLPGIRKFFRGRVTACEADDLTQEVYLHMLARSRTAAIENLHGYLFTVAANVLNAKVRGDRARHSRSHIEFNEDEALADENTPEHILLQRDQLQVLFAMIQELPPRTRDVFVLHRFEEMTYDAIARKMGISSSAVEKHMIKALHRLTARLTRIDR